VQVANFEVLRQVLLDKNGDGRFDADDRAAVRAEVGIDVPIEPLTPSRMQMLARRLDAAVMHYDAQGRTALTTFAVALAVDHDLYTLTSGDAVVSLYRPS